MEAKGICKLLKCVFILMLSQICLSGHQCVREQKIEVIDPPIPNARMLQEQQVYGLRINGVFPSETLTTINIDILKKIFSISSKYFESVIKVTNTLTVQKSKYPSNLNNPNPTCGISVPSSYLKDGFDVTKMDIVLFIKIQNNPQQNFIAYSTVCALVRWPTYGAVGFNAFYIDTNLAKTAIFHRNIFITIHEITHMLGFNNFYYNGYFFASYTSTNKLSMSQVIRELVVNGSTRKFIITKNVLNYVQNYFGCNDPTIGALLEDQGGTGSQNSHWERKVYLDQVLTASLWNSGFKITKLTLNLLKDTGFYYSIDDTKSDSASFGKNAGCQFAKGLGNSSPQYCTPSQDNKCDQYGFYSGHCISDSFSNGANLMVPYSNLICTMPEISTANSQTRFFDSMSRCFDSVKVNNAQCHIAECLPTGIKVTIGSQSAICTPGLTKLTLNNVQFLCPPNRDIFCSRRNCPNWCSTDGICINGQCVAVLSCTLIHKDCISCISTRCSKCNNNLYPSSNQLTCASCQTIIINCLSCWNNAGITRCSTCTNELLLSSDGLSCKSCPEYISNCTTCSNNLNVIKCTSCNTNLFLNINQDSCLSCQLAITNCNKCISNGVGTQCTLCNSGFYLNGKTNCQKCLTGCSQCSLDSLNMLKCSICQIDYFFNSNKDACLPCSFFVNGCLKCQDNAGIIQCLNCNQGLFKSKDRIRCQICPFQIQNCLTCFSNLGVIQCKVCSNNLFPTSLKNSCSTCSTILSNCISCTNNNGNTQCSLCDTAFYIKSNTHQCFPCSKITDCISCQQNQNTLRCSKCQNNKFPTVNNLNCNECSTIIQNCENCVTNKSNTICNSCVGMKFPSQNGQQCVECQSLIGNCKKCVNNLGITQCSQCKDTFLLSNDKKKCFICSIFVPNCQQCALGKCKTCIQDNFLSVDKLSCLTCSKRIENCVKCITLNQVVKCTQCQVSYQINTNQISCLICLPPCKTCITGTSFSCTSCNSGFFLNQNKCTDCLYNSGYYVSGLLCVKCPSICQTCSSDTKCLTCRVGFYLLANRSCAPCSPKCRVCSSLTSCTVCSNGLPALRRIC